LNEKTRERFREKIKAGQLDDRIIELDVPSDQFPAMQILGPMNLEEIGVNLQDVFGNLMPKKMKKRKLSIADAKKILVQEEAQKLIDQDAAAKFIDNYFEGYPGIEEFLAKVLADCRRNGYVRTILGRRRAISGVREGAGRRRGFARAFAATAPDRP